MEKYKAIKPLDHSAMEEAQRYIDGLAKPIGSLGELEKYAVRLAGIRGYMGCPFRKGGVLVFAADNGVHEESITPVPQAVTAMQSIGIARGVSGVGVFAKQAGSDVFVYNVGIAQPVEHERITDVNIMRGTNNMVKGPAMSREQCLQAFETGFQAAVDHAECDILGIGEMGICNTTTSSAVLSVLTGLSAEEVTGKGAGIDEEMFARKISCIKKAIAVNQPDQTDVFDVLSKVGGLDLAAMTGAFLGAAYCATPVVIDGFISVVAALCAVRLNPIVADYMFASHASYEIGYAHAIREIGLQPPLHLNMRLGEGSGCPLMFYLLNASLRMTDEMEKLDSVGLNDDTLVDIREK